MRYESLKVMIVPQKCGHCETVSSDSLIYSFSTLKKMKQQARSFSTEIKQIDLDVNRTFRNHIMFMDRFGVK